MGRMVDKSTSRVRTRRYRDGLRRRGLRPIQIWVPDLLAPGSKAEIERQCKLINAADQAENLMGWIEDVGPVVTRGDVIAVADRGGDFTSKLCPGVVVQSDLFSALDSVTICPVTPFALDAPSTRLQVEPSLTLSLRTVSWIAVDKITTVRGDRIGPAMGRLSSADVQRLNAAVAVFLGLGG
jgi:mRNA interferase MazF